jgi:molecular chaperone GrpE (heat shock protein)
MMPDVAEYKSVKANIEMVNSFAHFIKVSYESEEEKMNAFLDAVSEFTNDLTRLNKLFNNLEKSLLANFNTLTKQQKEDILPDLLLVKDKGVKLYSYLNKSKHHVGLASVLSEFKMNLDILKEITEDIKITEELKDDDEYNAIVSSFL